MTERARRSAIVIGVAALMLASGCLGFWDDLEAEPDSQGPGQTPGGGDGAPGGVYAPGWPAPSDATVRPGAKIVKGTLEGHCTANFLFSSPDNRTLYLGTASHCVPGMRLGETVQIAGGAVEGTLVYCSWGTIDGGETCTDKAGAGGTGTASEGFANDFALVELPESARDAVHPALVHWGGPTGLAIAPEAGTHVLTYGNTALRDADQPGAGPLDPREGYVEERGNWTTTVTLVPPSVSGDSGSPLIRASGEAVGVVQTVGAGTSGVTNGVVNLVPALAYVYEHTDLRPVLKTFRLLEEPTLPDQRPMDQGLDELDTST